MARTTKGDTASSSSSVQWLVTRRRCHDRPKGTRPGQCVTDCADARWWVVIAASRPPWTLGHLFGRSARGDLGAYEEGITIGSVRRRMGEKLPGLIANSVDEANTRGHSESRAGSN
jgi:hypothetical protein